MNFDDEDHSVSSVLSGKTVFAAASARLLPELTAGLRAFGANVLPVVVLEAKEIEDNAALDSAITNISQYDWIIFTSAWGVSFFSKRSSKFAKNAIFTPKICVIGTATAEAAEKHGFSITLTANEFTAEGVMQCMELYHGGVKNMRDIRVLIPRAMEARGFLPSALASAGCRVDTIPCYQAVMPGPDDETSARLQNTKPDLIVFTSAKTIRNYLKIAAGAIGEKNARRGLNAATVAVVGPVTARALALEGKVAEIIPSENSLPALLNAISGFQKN